MPQLPNLWGEVWSRAKVGWKSARGRRRRESQEKASGELAAALDDHKRCTLLSFYSPKCRLCRHVAPKLDQVAAEESGWLRTVSLDVGNEAWIPEVSYYSVGYVPCFVMLDKKGSARYKTIHPKDYDTVHRSLTEAISEGRKL